MNLDHSLSFLLLILTTYILFDIPGYLCQDQQYTACRQPFQCGNIRDISYPFYGGDKPASCGHPGFELDCHADVPLLNMSSMLYRVLEINNSAQTVRVVRNDLSDNPCPQFLYNTTLDFQIFDYSSGSDDQNITLHYNCRGSRGPYANQFNCSVNGTESSSFYVRGDVELPRDDFVCNDNILVPVNQVAARTLANPETTSREVFRDALASGFSIQWFADNDNCQACVRSGGVCGYDQNFVCYCADRSYSSTCNGTRSRNSKLGISIGLPIACVVLAGFGLGWLFLYCKKRRRKLAESSCFFTRKRMFDDSDEESNQQVATFMREHGSLAPRRYNYNEIKKMTNSFAHKLGQGGFGSVYKGTLPEGGHVAVKVLNKTERNGEEFINEVASISRTSHVNIVNLLGFCYGKRKRSLVYEFMPNKSLDKFLHQNVSTDTDFQLEWNKLYGIAVGVARGLEYLHRGCNVRIVHFDIKPQNILLDEEFHPKISDFGLAKLCRRKQSILTSVYGTRGTIGYIAPEVFCRNFGAVSHKSDVYSYGMMVLEMAGAREIEESSLTVESNENYFPDKIYEQLIVRKMERFDGMKSKEDLETVWKMSVIGFWCIQTAPSNRPSMSKVVEMLEGSVESIPIPPKPFLSSPVVSQQLELSSSFSLDMGIESPSACL